LGRRRGPVARLLVLLTSSTLDRLLTLGTLTLGAVSMGHEVDIYATHNGAFAFLREYADRLSYFHEPALSLPAEAVVKGMERAIGEGRFFRWYEMLRQAKEMGRVRIVLCTQAFDLAGFRVGKEELLEIVDEVTNIVRFVELMEESDHVITL
jgi:peroxiredoxin family protein